MRQKCVRVIAPVMLTLLGQILGNGASNRNALLLIADAINLDVRNIVSIIIVDVNFLIICQKLCISYLFLFQKWVKIMNQRCHLCGKICQDLVIINHPVS